MSSSVTVDKEGRRSFELIPPEGVPVKFSIAGLGSRFGALFLDILITYGGLVLIILLLAWIFQMHSSTWVTLLTLSTFLLRTPYYIATEIIWNGRTLGKRMLGIRVISADGTRLTPHQITVRNLMREAEFFLPLGLIFGTDAWWVVNIAIVLWALGLLFVPVFNKRRQRLGDMIAGTFVVETPKPVLAEDMSLVSAQIAEKFVFYPIHLNSYGTYELQTLEDILQQSHGPEPDYENIINVTRAIVRKIEYTDHVSRMDSLDFLKAFYKSQRLYLEQLKLYGKTRADKYFSHTED